MSLSENDGSSHSAPGSLRKALLQQHPGGRAGDLLTRVKSLRCDGVPPTMAVTALNHHRAFCFPR